MARALVLRDNAGSDERENMKWQTLQVSTFSIASCVGRILIGIRYSGLLSFCNGLNLLSGRCDCRLWKAQRDEARSMHLYSSHMLPYFSVGWPPRSGRQTPTIRGHLSWGFVWRGVRSLADYHHRMVWNGCAQSFICVGTTGIDPPFGIPSSNHRTQPTSQQTGGLFPYRRLWQGTFSP